MAALGFFSPLKNQQIPMHPIWSIYILADRFLRNSCHLVEGEDLSTFGCQFLSKRSFEKSKNTKDFLNLTLKQWQSDAFLP